MLARRLKEDLKNILKSDTLPRLLGTHLGMKELPTTPRITIFSWETVGSFLTISGLISSSANGLKTKWEVSMEFKHMKD